MSALTPFLFEQQAVRITDRNGNPWFVLVDVCRVLGIANSSDASSRLDDDEKSGVAITDPHGREQDTTVINESGLYSLVLTSRKPEAKRFKKWITGEVIPSIRRTGGYGTADPMIALNDPATMRHLLLGYSEKIIALESANAVLVPKAEALDRISKADGSLCITDAAKALSIPPRHLFGWLQERRWIFRRHGTGWLGYQDKTQSGLVEHKVTTIARADGSERVSEQVRITTKGLTRLAQEFDVRKAA